MKTQNELLGAALSYVRRGFSVIPLEPRGKKPLVEWKEFTERRAEETEIRKWWKRWPTANVGIVTGRISGLLVLDVDPDRGGSASELAQYPTAMRVRTGGGGVHLYYKYPTSKGKVRNRVGQDGIDVRGDDGYVVAPPSVHESGQGYSWISKGEPGEQLPPWVLESVRPLPAGKHWWDGVSGVEEGRRNDTCARLAGYLAGKGVAENLAQEFLQAWNCRNRPPMDAEEVGTTVSSIYRRHRAATDNEEAVLPKPKTVSELMEVATRAGQQEWHVEEILPAKSCGVLVASAKAGKTWLILQVALAIASGTRFVEKYTSTQSRVLLVLEEDDEQNVATRLRMLAKATGIELECLADRLLVICRSGLDVTSPESCQALENVILEGAVQLLVLDPLAEFFHGDENSAKDMKAVLKPLKEIRNRTGCSVLITHHVGKMERKPTRLADAARGSSYLAGWVDAGIYGWATATGLEIGVELRTARSPEPLKLIRRADGESFMFILGIDAELVEEPPTAAILEYLRSHPGASTNELVKRATGIRGGKDNRTEALRSLITRGAVVVRKEGASNRHYLTEQGEQLVMELNGADRGEHRAPLVWDGTGAAGRSLLGSPAPRPPHPGDREPFDRDHGPAPVEEFLEDGEVGWAVLCDDMNAVGWYERYWPEMLEELRGSLPEDHLEGTLIGSRQRAYENWLREVLSN